MLENAQAASIKLSEEDLKGINDTLAKFEVKGERYFEHGETVLVSRSGGIAMPLLKTDAIRGLSWPKPAP